MARRSSTTEDLGRQHNERRCEVLDRLNLENCCSYCDDLVIHSNADSLKELESKIHHNILELNRHGNVRFAFINGYKDYKRNFQVFHKLKSSNISDLHYLLLTDLERHMRLSSLLNHQRNVLSFYLTYVKDYCEKSLKEVKSLDDFESQLMKCLIVFHLIPPVTEINSCDEELEQYQNLASILRCCYERNLIKSHIVVQFLKKILNMHLVNSDDEHRIRHEIYDNTFLCYVVFHAENEKLNLNVLLSECSNTVWEFHNQFSILKAVVDGDRDRMLFLLNCGFQIFPEHEQMKSGHNFPDIAQKLTRPQLMILEIMERICKKNHFQLELLETVTEEQRRCFEIICREEPSTIFPTRHFIQALVEEQEYLLSFGIEKEKCESRRRKARNLVKLYANNFYDVPVADYEEIFVSISHVCNIPM